MCTSALMYESELRYEPDLIVEYGRVSALRLAGSSLAAASLASVALMLLSLSTTCCSSFDMSPICLLKMRWPTSVIAFTERDLLRSVLASEKIVAGNLSAICWWR